jgi:iron complex transport system ATP-binding protein
MAEPAEVVRIEGLRVVDSGTTILSVPELVVHERERWALLGPNGSGKTTLLSVIAGRRWPTSGRVTLLGETLGRVDLRELRARLGFHSAAVTRALRPRVSVHDVVVTGTDGALEPWWRTYEPAIHERADELLALLGVEAIAARQVGVISEGERARVLLARVLIGSPDLLCLDEPAAGLDLGARERLLDRLAGLMEDPGPMPIVLVTHHLEELPVGLTHALVLRSGVPWASGPIEEVVTSEVVSSAFDVDVEVVRHGDGRFAVRSAS